jgi:hypothetical protein
MAEFDPGDILIFQIESGYGLLRVLGIDGPDDDPVWHLSSYEDLFMDVETAEAALQNTSALRPGTPHLVLTDRAFLSTQVAKMKNEPLTVEEKARVENWHLSRQPEPSDRSVRLLLGLR